MRVAIGVFGVGEVLANARAARGRAAVTGPASRDLMPTLRATDATRFGRSLRGTALGFLLRRAARRRSDHRVVHRLQRREEAREATRSAFGKGAIEGVAGPESANNAAAQRRSCRCSRSASRRHRRRWR